MSVRVPHCKECDRCKLMELFYKEYYCCDENDPSTICERLGVDIPPKASPKWCPKREISKNTAVIE